MESYLQLLHNIRSNGYRKEDRTGTGTLSLFGERLVFDLADGFPILTTKKVFFKHVVTELLWFLRGDTNIGFLLEHGCKIWNEWADADGDLGPVYGAQWRAWRGLDRDDETFVDQMKELLNGLISNPDSRRHIVSAWNVCELPEMNLPPCHCLFQCYVRGLEMDLHLYQRSADVFLGVPFNIACYALLLSMLAHVTGHRPSRLIVSFGDVHIYLNHLEQVEEQLGREPRPLPSLWLNPDAGDLFAFTHEDICLEGYDPHPAIRAKVSV